MPLSELEQAAADYTAELEALAEMDDEQVRYLAEADTIHLPEDDLDCDDHETVDADPDAPKRGVD